jgi:acetolactate synthase-1/2/3 large subunit
MLFAAQGLTIDAPDGFFVANGLGGMGSGLGHAIGLQLALGSRRQVVAICGDGTLHLAGSELATCAQHEIPLVVVVFDDGQLGMVQHGDRQVFGRSHGWMTPARNLVDLAHAVGVRACRVESLADLVAVARGPRRGPTLLDVGIDPGVRIANPRVGTVRGSAGAS